MQRVEAIAEQMITDLTIAIAAEQVFSPAASDAQLMKCFQIGLAAPAFDFVRHMLLLSEVMALMRLWDNIDAVRSIPALVELMKDADIVDKLAERERLLTEDTKQFDVATLGRAQRKLAFSPARESADQRERDLRAGVCTWLARVKSAKGSAEVARLKKHRHEILAHNAASSKVPKVQQMSYVDPKRVLHKTIPIVSSGYLLATGRDHDFSTTVAMWNHRQFDMWEIVRCAARGEQFAPAPRSIADIADELFGGGSRRHERASRPVRSSPHPTTLCRYSRPEDRHLPGPPAD